jgi:AmmeMemoRadiSam system protein A
LKPGAAFVSLHQGEDLRGCVGYAEPHWPLAETVVRAGGAAAADRRFPALRPAELPDLIVEVSVLSPLVSIDPADVEVGVHGLVLRCGAGAGLLLPQVPVEQGWSREQFLESLGRKAGLGARAWQRPDAVLLAFTALRFR